MKQLTLAPVGMGADVAISPSEVRVVWRNGDPRLRGEIVTAGFYPDLRPGGLTRVFPVTAGANWPRTTYALNDFWLAYRNDANAGALIRGNDTAQVFETLYGSEPILLEQGSLWYQSAGAVWERPLFSPSTLLLAEPDTRPTGLSYVDKDANVVFVDDDRVTPYGTRPHRTAGLTVYEGANRGCVCRTTDGKLLTLWPGLDCFTPRCAASNGGWYVVTCGPDVRLAFITSADFPTEPVPVEPNVPALPRPLWIGYFKDPTGSGPGNCFHDEWTHHTLVSLPERKVIATPLDNEFNILVTPSGERWIGVQLYLPDVHNMAVIDAEIEMRDLAFRTVPRDVPVVLICQAFDRRTSSDASSAWITAAQLEAIQAVYPDVTRAYPNVRAILWFAKDRTGGVRDYPALTPWHTATVRANPGTPTIEEPSVPTLKKGTVLKLELKGLRTADGKHFVCAENGGGGEVNATRTAAGAWETFTVDAVVREDTPVDPR